MVVVILGSNVVNYYQQIDKSIIILGMDPNTDSFYVYGILTRHSDTENGLTLFNQYK